MKETFPNDLDEFSMTIQIKIPYVEYISKWLIKFLDSMKFHQFQNIVITKISCL